MQDDTQFAGNENNPYYDQQTKPVAQGSDTPTLPYTQGAMSQGAQAPEMTPSTAKRQPIPRKILIGGAVILIVLLLSIGGAVLLPKLAANANNQGAATTPTPAGTPATGAKKANIYAPYLVRYGPTIRSQIAQDLHLSTDQLDTQLNTGKTLSSIATAQGISDSQLQTTITNAFQSGFQPAISNGDLTQKQVDALVKRMLKQPKMLDRFLITHAKKGKGATPVPAVTPTVTSFTPALSHTA